MGVEETHAWLELVYSPEQYGPGHMNLIRLGREICHARKPECECCPLKGLCDYYQNLQETEL
jgi:endonuclease-3